MAAEGYVRNLARDAEFPPLRNYFMIMNYEPCMLHTKSYVYYYSKNMQKTLLPSAQHVAENQMNWDVTESFALRCPHVLHFCSSTYVQSLSYFEEEGPK